MTINPADRGISDENLRDLFSGEIPYRSEMTFYLDENIDRQIFVLLRERDIRVITVEMQEKKEKSQTFVYWRVLEKWDA